VCRRSLHIALLREGVRRACVFGPYDAHLVSLHADTIYAQYFNFNKASAEDAVAVRAFLDEQHRFQARTAASSGPIRSSPSRHRRNHRAHNRLLIAALEENCPAHPS
jgi:hypothetical protein